MLVTGALDGDPTKPLDTESQNWLNQFCKKRTIPLLIEADGLRQKPLKAWAEHEPPIPNFVEQVVQVVGLTGIGQTLSPEVVHRAEIFSALSRLRMGEAITPDALIRVLTHSDGGQKNIPAGARKTVLLDQADTTELQSVAHGKIAALLSSFHSIVISSMRSSRYRNPSSLSLLKPPLLFPLKIKSIV